jgi:hypothetical protein
LLAMNPVITPRIAACPLTGLPGSATKVAAGS